MAIYTDENNRCLFCHRVFEPTYRKRVQFYCSKSCRLKDYKETREILKKYRPISKKKEYEK